MKKCRKMLSAFLAVTVLLTSFAFTATVSAATADYEVERTVLDENFNSYTKFAGTADAGDMSAAGYGKHIYGSNYAALETIDGDQAVKLADGNDTIQYELSEKLTSGLVRISYSGKFGENASIFGVEVKEDYTKDGVLAVQSCYGRIVTYKQGNDEADKKLMSSYDTDKWYDFEVIVDLDNNKYSVSVSQDGNEIKTLSGFDFTQDIKYLAWRRWGGTAYIDNLKIEVLDDQSVVDPVEPDEPIEAGKLPLNDNFESYTTVTGGSGKTDMQSVGYGKHAYSDYYAGLTTVDGNKVVKFDKNVDSIRYEIADKYVPTEGKVKIAFSARYDEGACLLGPEITNAANHVGVLGVQAHSGKIVTKEAGAGSAALTLLNPYTPNKWYDFVMTVNLDTKTYDIEISADGTVLNTITGIEMINIDKKVTIDAVKYVSWRNWASGVGGYIDNLKIEVVEKEAEFEVGAFPLNDNFESYKTVSGGSGKTDMVSVGYGRHLYSDTYAELATVDGNKVVKFSKNVDSIRYQIADKYVPTSGKVKVAFSARYDEGACLLGPELADAQTNVGVLGVQAHSGKIVTKEAGANSTELTLLNAYTPNKWYDFVMLVDLDNNTYDVQISADGKVLNQLFDIALVCIDKSSTISGVKYVAWRNWTANASGYIDDLVIETTEEELTKVVETDILDDDFNDYLTVSGGTGSTDMVSSGYTKHIYGDVYTTLETVDGDQAVKFSRPGGKVDSIAYALSPALEASGKIKISYSGRFDAGASIVGAEIIDSKGKTGVLAAQVHDGIFSTNQLGAAAAQYTILGGYTADEWYDFEILVDFENMVYSVAVFKDSKQLGKLENLSLYSLDGDLLSDIKCVAWRNWSATGVGGYIDDLNIERYVTSPTISATKISTVDVKGNETVGMSNKLSPLTRKIVLDFGSDIKAATLKGAVTLKTEAGEDVKFEGNAKGKYYTMTLDKMLKSETKYVLTVADSVTNIFDKTLGTTFTLNFSTGTADSVAEISGLYVGTTKQTSLEGLKKGDKLTVKTNYANADDNSASAVWIIAYYQGNKLSHTESVSVTDIPAGKLGIDSPEFTVADLTDVTEICVYLWHDATSIKPYCEPARLTAANN